MNTDNHRFFRFAFLFLLLTAYSLPLTAQTKDYTKYVNPFIGTGGHGHTFPGATVPFGFVQLSPDTRVDNWDGSSGYHYSDDVIYGFSHTHLSGTGIPDYCDILFSPYVSDKDFFEAKPEDTKNGYASKFSHANEKAEAGYYSVLLEDENILAEMTASKRVGLHRYTFPEKTENAKITLDLKWRDEVSDSEIRLTGTNRIEGFRRSKSWAKDQIVYFVAEFSKPFEEAKIKIPEKPAPMWKYGNEFFQKNGENIKSVFRFEVSENEQLLLKVAISPVSIEGARKNLEAELNHWDFEKVRNDAKKDWNKELSKIEVSGGTDAEMTNFYTALYHTMIAPNIFQDVDGNFLGLDKKIHNIADDNRKSENYTVFSLWDTFRATHPLYTIIDEKRTVDFINTFIRQYEQGGKLPVWELAANETDTMIGYHSVSVIADAMAKDIKGFDYEKAYAAAKHSAEMDFRGLDFYRQRGYISMEDEQESVSKTLEYAYNDACIVQMTLVLQMIELKKLSKAVMASPSLKLKKSVQTKFDNKFKSLEEDFNNYHKRSQFYKNLFDKQTGFMRPKQNGNWVSPFLPNDVTFHFTEGNSWQYTFFVPHDVNGLISLYGGKENFTAKLDALFTTKDNLTGREQPDITGLIGQYAHGNEPSHHIAYLYNYADKPWKTQFYVRKIMDEFYKNAPDGLIGNEDCGQMSAWYVMSALGFYQVNPSREFYDIGTPLFKEAKIHLENGKIFTIKAPNVSEKNVYVKSVKLDEGDHKSTMFSHRDIKGGKTLEFEMSDKPNKTWFDKFSNSATGEGGFVAVPIISSPDRVFKETSEITIQSNSTDAKILYSLDGNEPNIEYKQPFTIDKTVVIKSVAVNSKGQKSLVAESKLNKMPNDWDVKLFSTYNRQYTGGGVKGLVDGIRGTTNFASGEWQGYQDQDFIAVIDLKRETEIKKLGGGFLQVARSWIWMPTKVEFEVSDDGENFRKVAEIETKFPEREMEHTIKDYVQAITPTKARFVRVKATNLGKIPEWHPGAGYQAFIFVDEIFIQ